MKIIAQIDESDHGNDCFIYNQWVLAELFNQKVMLHFTRAAGHWRNDKLETATYPEDYEYNEYQNEAKEMWDRLIEKSK